MNTWLHDLSDAYKTKYNIKEERDVSIQQQDKGLVWSNFQKRAMYDIQQVLQNNMLNVHGTYISCHDPKGNAKNL